MLVMYAQEKLKSDIIDAVSKAAGMEKEAVKRIIEKPPEGVGADYAFPCFVLAKIEKRNPAEIAKKIASSVKCKGFVQKVEASGPYVNFFADWRNLGDAVLKEIIKTGGKYGSGKTGGKKKVMIEFAHPNTHKAFHIGHVRNITLGESLCRMLECSGARVVRANYQGDIGPHVAKCLWGLLNLGVKMPENGSGKWLGVVYAKASQKVQGNKNLEKEVTEINKKLYARDREITGLWEKTRKWSLDYFEKVYADFGVKYDRYYFESEVESGGVKLAEELAKKGIAQESEGAIIMDLKKYNLGVFVLLTKEKTPLYSIKDMVLAGLQEKEYKPDRIIHVVGTEQNMYFRQLFKALEIVNPDIAKKEKHIPYELVNLKEGKMASRLGNVITYDELKAQVLKKARHVTREKNRELSAEQVEKIAEATSMGSIKYDMIKTGPEKTITFDWDLAVSFEGNTAPYMQYTHARACSILKKSGAKDFAKFDAKFLSGEKEMRVLKKLAEFPEAIGNAARDYRPHYIANYVFELATLFNEFYQSVPVLKGGSAEKEARLALVAATRIVLGNCLWLLGIEAPEEM